VLLEPTGSCPTCQEPIVFAALRNLRNGRWVVLPIDPVSAPEGVIVVLEPPTVHATVDLAGADAGTWQVVEYGPQLAEPRFRPHPPSHWSLEPTEAQ
jgi:hypothetical protein